MGLLQQEESRRLLYVLSDGKLREQVDEHTEGAKLRVVKDDAGNVKAEKWELTYPGIKGFITQVTTYDGDYGTNVNVSIKDSNDEEFILSLKANSKYGEDFLHKLPNIDMTKEITIKPYDFESDGRRNTGVSLTQGETKIGNAFNFKNASGEWESVEGYPQPDAKTKEKGGEKWTIFFAMRRDWLIEHLTEKGLITESASVSDTKANDEDESF
jgi:hypothetical protein